jgi:hypothetical protein
MHDAHDLVVHVMALWPACRLSAAGHNRRKTGNQLVAQRIVVGQQGEIERAVPGADLGVADGLDSSGGGRVRDGLPQGSGHKMLGQCLANLLRRDAARPHSEVARCRRNDGLIARRPRRLAGRAGDSWSSWNCRRRCRRRGGLGTEGCCQQRGCADKCEKAEIHK